MRRRLQSPRFVMPMAATAGLLLLAGCGSDGDAPSATATETAARRPAAAPATPAGIANLPQKAAPIGRSHEEENELFDFEYAYPPVAAAIPRLKAVLDAKFGAARAELEKESKADKAEAEKVDYPYRPHSFASNWLVVTDIPRWLSLSAEIYEYAGGAHGMTLFDGLVWDKQENVAHKPIALFSSKAALSKALRTPFCAELDKQRAKRRGAPVDRNSGDQFDECIDPAESTLILGSSNGRTFDRIGVLVEPYAAGAYAEGTFELTLPVTDAVLAAVKPEYRDSFSVKR